MSQHFGGRVTITFMSGPQDGKTLEWPLADEGEGLIISIGRREGCDIILAYDSQVSRLHARVLYESAQHNFFLEDTGSRNGTFINGARLDGRVPLKSGTLFRVGRTWLRLDPSRTMPPETDDDNTQF